MSKFQIESNQIIAGAGFIIALISFVIGLRRANNKELKNSFDKKANADDVNKKFENMDNTINLKIEGLKNDINRHEATFHSIDKKLNDMPQRIVDLLSPFFKNK